MPVASICANIAIHTVGTPALWVTPSSCIRSHRTCASLVAEKTSFAPTVAAKLVFRSEEHTSELQSLMRISYAVFCLKKKKKDNNNTTDKPTITQNTTTTTITDSKHMNEQVRI